MYVRTYVRTYVRSIRVCSTVYVVYVCTVCTRTSTGTGRTSGSSRRQEEARPFIAMGLHEDATVCLEHGVQGRLAHITCGVVQPFSRSVSLEMIK